MPIPRRWARLHAMCRVGGVPTWSRHRPFRPALALLLTACLAVPAVAQTIKPGLWEIKQQPQLDATRQAQLEQAQKQMAALPPEQRKMVEQMMASRGVSMDLGSGGAITIKSCVSKEQAEKAMLPQTQGKCDHDIKRNGNVMTGHFRCADPTSEGNTELVFQGDDRYTTKTEVRTERGGKTETLRSTGEARWLGSDCGNLKPATTTGTGTR
ncbi:DUF3617 domain-containing protein [Roseateles amylovorans]|uniref:DUF3617 domain-containing protein n=1 Tax=Roseateles amylovorans TaxID=2978473 RepID=A0ABY6AT52_9BURK|nr:DUF3617 domain-containing protein [Roseateles amylovorans]UXH76406.1 DUF3617 domain-containing protein [Roseateles amylovorans]